ncbi:uncharacterized protein LOC135168824 [Diachasmimorpha longicaudata]|uniref:uncharacterized protein LOC135168824 n=1 Tax=Diachasmimorpha longicaudata TaxID=58733 RepID=UPI0030B8CAF7
MEMEISDCLKISAKLMENEEFFAKDLDGLDNVEGENDEEVRNAGDEIDSTGELAELLRASTNLSGVTDPLELRSVNKEKTSLPRVRLLL